MDADYFNLEGVLKERLPEDDRLLLVATDGAEDGRCALIHNPKGCAKPLHCVV